MTYIALVIGGILGGVLRYAISLIIPSPDSFPLGILLINLGGSWILGVFYRFAEIHPIKPWFRIGFCTGVIGTFTTFSTFCSGADSLAASHFWSSAIYMITSIIGGPILAFGGDRSVLKFARCLVNSPKVSA